MAIAQRHVSSLFALLIVLGISLLSSGCCGPMAYGPMGCGGCATARPMMFGGGCGNCGNCDGCGEVYVDEWVNHPPTCDPCDSCGNHNGQTCGSCRPMFDGFKSLWGYRRDCGCDSGSCGGSSCDGGCSGGCSGGCQSCGGGGEEYISGDSEMGQHYVESSPMPISHRPTPAPRIVEAKPAVKPYQPQHTKQIFRPKGSVAGNPPRPSNY